MNGSKPTSQRRRKQAPAPIGDHFTAYAVNLGPNAAIAAKRERGHGPGKFYIPGVARLSTETAATTRHLVSHDPRPRTATLFHSVLSTRQVKAHPPRALSLPLMSIGAITCLSLPAQMSCIRSEATMPFGSSHARMTPQS